MKNFLSVLFLVILFTNNIYANDNSQILDKHINNFSINKYDGVINKKLSPDIIDYTFSDLVKKCITGEMNFNLNTIYKYILNKTFSEIYEQKILILNIVVICILSAILKQLTTSFKNHSISELAFYMCYIYIAFLLAKSFSIGVYILEDTINSVFDLIKSLMPLMSSLLIASGFTLSATTTSAFMLGSMTIFSIVISNFIIPLINISVALNIINFITPRSLLKKLTDFLKWILSFSLKAIAVGFTTVLSLQKISSGIFNTTINKTVQTTINYVPVVGEAMRNAVDGVMHWILAFKSGVGIAIVIVIILICALPTIKLLVLVFMYKIIAILIEPISDKRIVNCIDTIGEYTLLVFSSLITFNFILLISVIIILNITGY